VLELRDYLDLTIADAEQQWRLVVRRSWMPAGSRQVDFLPIETLLCFGLGLIGNRSASGNINISERSPAAVKVARTVKRTPKSLAAKLANLDGRRPNSAKNERVLWAALSNQLAHFEVLYEVVMEAARRVGLDDEMVPDFLGLEVAALSAVIEADRVSTNDLRESIENEIRIWSDAHPDDDLLETERAILGTARVGQQQFARKVLTNAGFACVFCGLSFKAAGLPSSRMLVASHIKPWRHSVYSERLDPLNGLAACPTHDAAFDALLITVMPDLTIRPSTKMLHAIDSDPAVAQHFGEAGMAPSLLLGPGGTRPMEVYLKWHREAMMSAAA
jgi:putative restriction endonuclease